MNIFSKMKRSVQWQERRDEKQAEQKAQSAVAFVHGQSQRRHTDRLRQELQWKLNANFLYGNQHCDLNLSRMTVESYEPTYDYLSREVFNRIAPLMETRLANLQTVRYKMSVLPRTNEYEDALKAQISTALLRAKQEASDFSEKLDSALHWSELTGSAFFFSGWDASAGNVFVLPGEQEGDDECACEGDVTYCVLSPYEVLPDSIDCETVADQHSILIEQVKSCADVEALYGKKVQAEQGSLVSISASVGVSSKGACFEDDDKDRVLLYTYLERPNVNFPQGRMILVAGSTLIHEGSFPYGEYPLCQMKSQRVAGQFYGRSVIESLIPLQRTYNGIKNKINDYINLAASGQLLIEEGSVDADDLAGNGVAPGIPVVYERGSEKPALLPWPSLPSVVAEQCDRIAADMEYASGVSQLLVSGRTPDGITSGKAINTLRNIDSTRLSMTADNAREAVRALAVIWLRLYHEFGGENRAIVASGRNSSHGVLYWSADQIDSFEVIYDSENELKDSEQSRFDRLLSAMDRGLFGGQGEAIPKRVLRKARQSLGVSNLGVTLEEDLQEQNAQNENLTFERGGQLSLQPLDDHVIHLEEHRMYALQSDFREMARNNAEKAGKMYDHILAHQNALQGGIAHE
ncbi:MAG: hypothetical protein E7599_04690 [Ruminococcaceae bacterium]|nr:hypothetical protein [Oscillospiraceae bacterium]